MKKIFLVFVMAAGFSACNNAEKRENAAKADALDKQQMAIAIKDSIRLDSFKRADAAIKAKKEETQASTQRVVSSRTSGSSTSSSNYGGTTAPVNKKKGWSEAAKGATIGGLAGAVGGAIIDKKKGRGAVIGGVIGAGTGYVIGHEKDKKSGRAN